jgi:hypothetical protein
LTRIEKSGLTGRRGRKDYAKDAKKTKFNSNFLVLICVLCQFLRPLRPVFSSC